MGLKQNNPCKSGCNYYDGFGCTRSPIEGSGLDLTLREYQKLAARTIRDDITKEDTINHALSGMVSELGELFALYQKKYQGHMFDEEHAAIELGDLLWFVAEYCSAMHWNLGDVALININKLRARYPEGFDAEHSLHRAKGDV